MLLISRGDGSDVYWIKSMEILGQWQRALALGVGCLGTLESLRAIPISSSTPLRFLLPFYLMASQQQRHEPKVDPRIYTVQ